MESEQAWSDFECEAAEKDYKDEYAPNSEWSDPVHTSSLSRI